MGILTFPHFSHSSPTVNMACGAKEGAPELKQEGRVRQRLCKLYNSTDSSGPVQAKSLERDGSHDTVGREIGMFGCEKSWGAYHIPAVEAGSCYS